MKKVLGIFGLLIFVCAFTALKSDNFLSAYNIQNTLRWTGLYGIISIGVAFVIITGGIDLSIGSVIGLLGAILALLLTEQNLSVPLALLLIFLCALAIGLTHGLLITKVKLQPFVVTLCGLLIYRGLARFITEDRSIGFGKNFDGLRSLATGGIPLTDNFLIPTPFIIMLVVAAIAGILLRFTLYGRYLFALGNNEDAARYSGINTTWVIVASYIFCSLLAGLSAVLFSLDINTIQPSGLGEFYELYAIAAAVLGGCSLRGGEGTILGVIIGAALMRVLYNAINILGIDTSLEFAIIGGVILAGVSVDELLKSLVARRRAGNS